MHYYEVAPNQIVRTDSASFTYTSEKRLSIGQIVLIEVGKKQMIGVILRQTTEPSYKTKHIISVIEKTALPEQLINTALWISKYYVTPLATVLQTILPRGIQKSRRPQPKESIVVKRNRTNIVFNKEQSKVIDNLSKHKAGTFLLHGITGSGKTEIYIDIAKRTIASKASVIILVPEIALTPQLISEFSNHFDNLLVTHSKMSESSRHIIWTEALNSNEPRVVIGPRSALFLPLHKVGAIIIDEAHEPSFKQEKSPKYSALRVATILGRYHKAMVVFGSATPNIIDYYLAKQSDKPILELTKIARTGSLRPDITVVDIKKRNNFKKHHFLSDQLLEQISKTLLLDKQVLIFHNRRGSTRTTLCENCGWMSECPNCYLPLTLHADNHKLCCHVCGYNTVVPTSCPTCNSVNIIHKGIGTKLIESELLKIFPNTNIARFDADNTINETMNSRYRELYDGTIDIAIGTQIVAKGLDLPHLRTVGVIHADAGLTMPDFSSNERTFQLLAQVIGRVGRNEHQTQVIVQSYQPSHPSIMSGLTQDYKLFYNHTLDERKRGIFPPFTHLLKLTCIYKTEAAAIKNSQILAKELIEKVSPDIQVLGPTPAFYERQNDTYRWQLVLKSPKREHLINVLKLIPSTHWQFELDPTSLL